MLLIDYHSKQIVATFNGTNTYNAQIRAWIHENDYLVHRKAGNNLIIIKKGI